MQTSVVVEDGQSLLIGGIIADNKRSQISGIPLLSKIPYLGALFRTTIEQKDKTELLILITPHVIANQHGACEGQ